MCNYVETFYCNDKYNVVHIVYINISYCRKLTLAAVFLSDNIMKTRQF